MLLGRVKKSVRRVVSLSVATLVAGRIRLAYIVRVHKEHGEIEHKRQDLRC
jgi:hypothetical protein